MPIGIPGWPELAFCTPSAASMRITLAARFIVWDSDTGFPFIGRRSGTFANVILAAAERGRPTPPRYAVPCRAARLLPDGPGPCLPPRAAAAPRDGHPGRPRRREWPTLELRPGGCPGRRARPSPPPPAAPSSGFGRPLRRRSSAGRRRTGPPPRPIGLPLPPLRARRRAPPPEDARPTPSPGRFPPDARRRDGAFARLEVRSSCATGIVWSVVPS